MFSSPLSNSLFCFCFVFLCFFRTLVLRRVLSNHHCQSVHQFGISDFCTMVGKFKYFKTDLAFFFPGKFIFGFKMTPQEGFSDFLKMNSYLAKFWFANGPKCFWPIKLQDFLKCNISKKSE